MSSLVPVRLQGSVGLVAGAVAAAAATGVLVAARPRLGMLLIAAFAVAALVRALRLSLTELVLVTMPLMFFPPIGFLLNVAVADFLMPVLVVLVWTGNTRASLDREQRAVVRRCTSLAWILLFVTLLSGLVGALRVDQFNLLEATLDTMKLVVVLVYFVTLLVAFMALTDRGRLRAARIWVWCAVAQSVCSLVGLVPSDGVRSLGYFQDPNLYAGYLLSSIALLFYVVARHRMTAWPVALLLLFGGVLSTGSRGALAAAAVLLAISAIGLLSSRIGTLLMAGTTVLVAVLLFVPDILSRLVLPGVDRLLTSAENAGTDPRWRLWGRAWELWLDHPLLGVGVGQFTEYSVGLTPFRQWTEGQVAHNTFLSFAAEGGIVGLLAFSAILVAAVWFVHRSVHLTKVQRMALVIGVLVIVVMMMTLNLQNLRYVWAFLAFAIATAASADPSDDHDDGPLPVASSTSSHDC